MAVQARCTLNVPCLHTFLIRNRKNFMFGSTN